MSPPDLDRLLVLPYGCGEQNMVRTGLNWVVAEYLQNTGQLSDHIAVKIRRNILTGEQCIYFTARQLPRNKYLNTAYHLDNGVVPIIYVYTFFVSA